MPHWEWRTFDVRLNEFQSRLQQHIPFRMRSENEIYLLSDKSVHNCKVRLHRNELKIKILLESNDLELWQVILRARFPISEHQLRILFQKLEIVNNDEFSFLDTAAAFVKELADKVPQIVAIPVAKVRMIYRFDDMEAELAKLRIGDSYSAISFAAEDRDPLKVRQIRDIYAGNYSYNNQNYSAWLKSLMHAGFFKEWGAL